ncbi:MAG: hypothetical protein ACYS0E_03190 [Planctomycetota bacterium]
MRAIEITELWGDGIGPELKDAVHCVAGALPIELEFKAVDLTLESRRIRGKAIYDETVESMRATKLALKYPTGASANYSFDANGKVDVAMVDPAGGTAPDIAGQDKANPTAALPIRS